MLGFSQDTLKVCLPIGDSTLMYGDANGDSIVNQLDLVAVSSFYGKDYRSCDSTEIIINPIDTSQSNTIPLDSNFVFLSIDLGQSNNKNRVSVAENGIQSRYQTQDDLYFYRSNGWEPYQFGNHFRHDVSGDPSDGWSTALAMAINFQYFTNKKLYCYNNSINGGRFTPYSGNGPYVGVGSTYFDTFISELGQILANFQSESTLVIPAYINIHQGESEASDGTNINEWSAAMSNIKFQIDSVFLSYGYDVSDRYILTKLHEFIAASDSNTDLMNSTIENWCANNNAKYYSETSYQENNLLDVQHLTPIGFDIISKEKLKLAISGHYFESCYITSIKSSKSPNSGLRIEFETNIEPDSILIYRGISVDAALSSNPITTNLIEYSPNKWYSDDDSGEAVNDFDFSSYYVVSAFENGENRRCYIYGTKSSDMDYQIVNLESNSFNYSPDSFTPTTTSDNWDKSVKFTDPIISGDFAMYFSNPTRPIIIGVHYGDLSTNNSYNDLDKGLYIAPHNEEYSLKYYNGVSIPFNSFLIQNDGSLGGNDTYSVWPGSTYLKINYIDDVGWFFQASNNNIDWETFYTDNELIPKNSSGEYLSAPHIQIHMSDNESTLNNFEIVVE